MPTFGQEKWLTNSAQGLNHATERHGFEGEGFSYLKSPTWWAGVSICMETIIAVEPKTEI